MPAVFSTDAAVALFFTVGLAIGLIFGRDSVDTTPGADSEAERKQWLKGYDKGYESGFKLGKEQGENDLLRKIYNVKLEGKNDVRNSKGD